ncbi:hypothetical protein LSAT2_032781, partial [Lamellibrachia satsuma]
PKYGATHVHMRHFLEAARSARHARQHPLIADDALIMYVWSNILLIRHDSGGEELPLWFVPSGCWSSESKMLNKVARYKQLPSPMMVHGESCCFVGMSTRRICADTTYVFLDWVSLSVVLSTLQCIHLLP